jgi:hypothetical protein
MPTNHEANGERFHPMSKRHTVPSGLLAHEQVMLRIPPRPSTKANGPIGSRTRSARDQGFKLLDKRRGVSEKSIIDRGQRHVDAELAGPLEHFPT